MKKRLLSTFLSLCMMLTMVPAAFATGGGDGSQTIQKSPVTETDKGVTVSKSLSGSGGTEDPYMLTLEAYASNMTSTTSTTTPLDIVLVLDVSGSMADKFGDSTEEWKAQYGEWSYDDIGGWGAKIYYFYNENDRQYYKVEAVSEKMGNGPSGYTKYSLGYYDENRDFYQIGVPVTGEWYESYETIYTGELYTKETQSNTKMDAMQTAVNSFIDSVAENNESHRISIVSFAGSADREIGLTEVDPSGVAELKAEVNGLNASGATNSADGLAKADDVLDNARKNANQVVILFTDGEPTTSDTFSPSVASKAVNEAHNMKENGVTVYTVGIFEGANPDNLTDDTNKYMNAVSSNYPDAQVQNRQGEYRWNDLDLSSLKVSDKEYYFAADDSASLNDVFQGIAESVTTGTLDDYDFANSALTDVLSQYFDFPADINTSDKIEVKYVKAESYDADTNSFTFASEASDLPQSVTATANGDTISITGFDYKEYAASYNATTQTVSGGKLVVTFPIELDEAACVAAPIGEGYYPTNSKLSLSYTKDKTPTATETIESPLVPYDVSKYDANGTDITVQVYVDGALQTNPLSLVTISRIPTQGTSETFDYFEPVGSILGNTITYDFDYNTDNGHDCVDIDVALKSDNYVLQGIVYNQDYGSNGGKDVTASGGTYTVDNVTAQGNDTDPDVKIYLSTKYTVQYYKDSAEYDTATGTFIAHEGVETASFIKLEEAGQHVQSWKNSGYATSVQLKSLPADVDNTTYTGWYLGSATNTGTKYAPENSLAISAENDKAGSDAEDHIIKLYAVGQAKTGTVTIKYVNESNESIANDKVATGDNGAPYEITVASNAEDSGNDIPFVITTEEHTTYVFDHIAEGSAALSGKYTAAGQTITAVYAVDENKNNVPDKYEATVTYKIVNGTWDDGSNTKKTATFVTHEFDSSSNSWTALNPKLGEQNNSVPTDMQPAAGYDRASGSWGTEIPTNSTAVVNEKEYTYTFSTQLAYTVTFNYVTDEEVELQESKIDSTTYHYNQTYNYDGNDTYVPNVIEKDNNRYIYEPADQNLSGTITGNVTITLTYTLDNWDDEDDKVTGGDDIPDKYQAVVKFMSANEDQGTVTGDGITQVFTLKDGEGNNSTSGNITPEKTVSATPKEGYVFDIWTKDAVATTDSTGVNPFVAQGVEGGKVITFYANFAEDTNGDSTPDKYQATVTYKVVGGTWDGTPDNDEPISEVFKLKNYDETTGQWKAANPTLGSTIPNQMKPDASHIGEGSWDTTIASSTPVTENVTYTYTFDAAEPGLSISKTLSSVTRGTATLEDKALNDYVAQVGDTLHYTITVKNTGNTVQSGTITDTFTVEGNTSATLANVKATGTSGTIDTSQTPWTFNGLEAKDTITITAQYTIQPDDTEIVNTVTSAQENDDKDDNTVTITVPTVTITPADITIYTGGKGYGGVTDGDGKIIASTQASGLPEPGYHLELTEDVQQWLTENGIADGSDLTDELHFTYNVDGTTRDWKLNYVGVYSTEPTTRYVYSLAPATVDEEQIPVRLAYTDAEGDAVDDDDILMTETSVNATYTMSIDSGDLDQSQIKAQFTVGAGADQKTLTCNVKVDTGTLTVKSVADKDETTGQSTTNAIAADATTIDSDIITAVADDVKYYVNDSKVQVDAERVALLVDEVSNSDAFNNDMGTHAIGEVNETLEDNLTNPASESAYLDLVDTQNGNAVVTMGDGDELTIYWPVPADAASDSDFYVVHYNGMNREDTVTADALDSYAETVATDTTTIAGQQYVTFKASSFSPYVLVYSGTHTVTFNEGANGSLAGDDDNDGNVIVSNIADGSKLTNEQIPAVTADSGYSFTGWKMSGDPSDKVYSNEEIATMTITDDMTFTAQYTSSGGTGGTGGGGTTTRYTLTYESNGGTEYDSERYTRNTVVDLDKVPSREGYTFTGWYADAELTEQISEIKMTSDKTVYAGWEVTGVPDWLNGDDHFAYVIGYSDGTVKPLNNISRAEVATIFFRLLKPEIRDEYLTQSSQFTDVSADAWYNTAVSTMAALGIVNGRTADTFAPDASITRAEFAAICARFDTNKRDGDSNFSDIAGHWAEAEIERAATLGWINGYSDGTFHPDNAITRAEAMTMINRVLQRLPETEDDLLDDMNVWPDNQPSAWYYLAVQEATNSHDFDHKDDGVHETWTSRNTDPDWMQYQ